MRKFGLLTLSLMALVPAVSQAQSIYNGDFSLGDTGFTTDYNDVTGMDGGLDNGGAGGGAQNYAIGTNPNFYHPQFQATPALPLSMLVNGALDSTKEVWGGYATSALTVGQTYTFSVDVANISPTRPATLDVYFNGSKVNVLSATAGAAANNTLVTNSFSFVADAAGMSANSFQIFDSNTNSSGNDFAITNIKLQSVPEPISMALLGLGGIAALRRRKA